MGTHTTTSLLTEAVGFHQKGQFDAAKVLYRRVLDMDPRQSDALHLLGVVARQQGDAELAVKLISDAIAINASQAPPHCNLGAALQDLGRPQDALASYERAIAIDPQYALALSNRGNALRILGRLIDAVASYDRALAARPNYPEAWCNRAIAFNDLDRPHDALASADKALAARQAYAEAWCARANALQALGRFAESVESYDRAIAIKSNDAATHCARGTALQRLQQYSAALAAYERAIELRPGHPLAYQYRANTLRALGRTEDAIASYREALALGGERTHIEFALAALGVGNAPDASPAGYVKALFDQYAGHFDQHLVGQLGYRTPAYLDEAIRKQHLLDVDVLDLGCGTGLCAPYLRRYARRLAGVDLSDKMLDKAREQGLYDELACADISQYLSTRNKRYALVVAADVFVYFGDLGPVFAQVHTALGEAGFFCFSVEKSERAEFTLTPSNRYAHSLAYLHRLAGSIGFELVEAVERTLRSERDTEVLGYVVLMRKLAGSRG